MSATNFDRYIPFEAAESLILEVADEMELQLGSRVKKGIWIGAASGAALGTGILPVVGTAIGAITGALGMAAIALTANSARNSVRTKRTFELIHELTLQELDNVIRVLSHQNAYPMWSKTLVYHFFESGEMKDAVDHVLSYRN